ncbi:MAG: DUF4244 domain-containing protein [Propionibacteriaceae bacterium]|nr:DUF4244 domain-containing protein [Propionibacteriaceae bacterium]
MKMVPLKMPRIGLVRRRRGDAGMVTAEYAIGVVVATAGGTVGWKILMDSGLFDKLFEVVLGVVDKVVGLFGGG